MMSSTDTLMSRFTCISASPVNRSADIRDGIHVFKLRTQIIRYNYFVKLFVGFTTHSPLSEEWKGRSPHSPLSSGVGGRSPPSPHPWIRHWEEDSRRRFFPSQFFATQLFKGGASRRRFFPSKFFCNSTFQGVG